MVGKNIPTIITTAMKKGDSQQKRTGSGWMIDVSELVRLWPVISGVSDVTPPTLQSAPPLKNGTLERDVELLSEMLDVTKAERDSWKSQVQKVTALMENQSAKKGF